MTNIEEQNQLDHQVEDFASLKWIIDETINHIVAKGDYYWMSALAGICLILIRLRFRAPSTLFSAIFATSNTN